MPLEVGVEPGEDGKHGGQKQTRENDEPSMVGRKALNIGVSVESVFELPIGDNPLQSSNRKSKCQ
jgi:hypothetical protein